MGVRIFWAVVLGFCGGVFLQSLAPLGIVVAAWLVALAGVVVIAHPLAQLEWRVALLTVCALVACAGGIMRMHGAALASDPMIDAYISERVQLEGIVRGEPDVRENSVRFTVGIESVGSTTVHSGLSAIVSVPLHSPGAYGDRVRAEGTLRVPESFETGEGRQFDYPGFLAKDRIMYQMSFARVEVIGSGEGNRLKSGAIWIKQTFLEGLTYALPEPYAGLAGGITVGDKRGLGEELSETFRVVGLTHIVVLSGYNIMVVVGALLRVLSRAPQAIRFSLGAGIALFFAAITGFAAASTRAALMAMIAIAGKASRRTYLATRVLAVVALGMIAWNPYVLLFDPGFQLSVVATLGLVVLAPAVEPYLSWLTARFGVREIAAGTVGTQIAVLPLLLYQTGSLSLVALPANLLVLVVLPFAMLFSALAALFGLLTGFLAPFFGFPALVLLSYMVAAAQLFAALPFAALQIPVFGAGFVFLFYSALLALALHTEKKPHP